MSESSGPAEPTRQSSRHQNNGARGKLLAGLLGTAVLLLLVAMVFSLTGGKTEQPLIYYTVKRGKLPISVTERGNLESQNEVKVVCQVDDVEGDGIHGTPILWIVPNGSSVKEGELIVELDSSNHQERLDRQVLSTERARSDQIQAKVKYENQKTQNLTKLAEAKLKVDLSDLALKQYEDEDGGTFQIDLQDVELIIQEAQASKLIEETNLQGVQQLYDLGYRNKNELDQARLNAMKVERQLAKAISQKKLLVEYQYRKSKMELLGSLDSAKRSLEQVERDNDALLEQARASMKAADESLKKEEERLARYQEQLVNCKIYAPQSGMVAYHVGGSHWRREEVREGATVRLRQTILTIPNLKKMQVKTAVHESVLDQIQGGLPVTIRADAFPEKSYNGSVFSVAVLPDQDHWMSSDTKVYRTVITIDEEVDQLKPGMTAVVEIHVDLLENVLSVPVQAIVQKKHESWCYVANGSGAERRLVELGLDNDKFVEIRNGIEEGDSVVLNPMAIIDETEEDDKTISPEGDGPIPDMEKFRKKPGAGPQSTDLGAAPSEKGGGERPGPGNRPPAANLRQGSGEEDPSMKRRSMGGNSTIRDGSGGPRPSSYRRSGGGRSGGSRRPR